MLNDDVLGEILVHSGPATVLLRHAPDVLRNIAARRVQRRWRSVRLVPGRTIRWKFVGSTAWETGSVESINERLCIARHRPKHSYLFLPHPGVTWSVIQKS